MDKIIKPFLYTLQTITIGQPAILVNVHQQTIRTSPVEHFFQHPDGSLTIVTKHSVYQN